ncbi:MAG: PotD/PotF family extracellular solute-binding protein, partial [Alphaproteobacteria bacterium]|nr:PotD/PotF family extracellular solute-binding protein [Alphaproteobacteria bacterium]
MTNRLTRRLFGASVAALALMGSYAAASAADLNALVWCDHSDPNLLKPFEDATGIKVNVKEFEGTGAGLAIVDQSQPGDWDVMVIDTVDVRRGVDRGLFEPLPEDKLPMADIFPEVLMNQHAVVDGKRYGVTEKFGYNTIGFNKSKV